MKPQPVRYDQGKLDTLLTASSTTIAKGDFLTFASGYVQRATSSDTVVHCIAMEDMVTVSGHESIEVLWVDGAEIEADTAGSATQALVGTFIDLTDHDTLNQAASTTNAFLVKGLVSASRVRGVFVQNVS